MKLSPAVGPAERAARKNAGRRRWVLPLLPLLLVVGCGGPGPAAPAQGGHVRPAFIPLAAAVPFSRCQSPDAQDHPTVGGGQWLPGKATARSLGCHLSLRTVTPGGSLEISFEASSTPQPDVRDRLKDLVTVAGSPGVLALGHLAVGSSAGGVVFTGGSQVRYLLYVSTATTVVSVVCVVPTGHGRAPETVPGLTLAAQELLVWVLAHQPGQG